jgi:hypothetical protein
VYHHPFQDVLQQEQCQTDQVSINTKHTLAQIDKTQPLNKETKHNKQKTINHQKKLVYYQI